MITILSSPALVHRDGQHLATNLVLLVCVGSALELVHGTPRILLLYLLGVGRLLGGAPV